MSFIQPDEFIVLFHTGSLSMDDLKRISDAGIKTAVFPILWEQIETKDGSYNWERLDAEVERLKEAGIKSLMRCHENAPDWFPEDWYLRSASGSLWRNLHGYGGSDRFTLLSLWCKDAMERQRAFMRACNERYHDEWAQVYAGSPHAGEVLLPGMIPCYYDSHAITSYRSYTGDAGDPPDIPTYASMKAQPKLVEWLRASLTESVKTEQNIFPEIWLHLVERDTKFAEAFESGPRSGNWLMAELCEDLPKRLSKKLNIILWEVNRYGGDQGALENVKSVLDKVWIGSQFASGLYTYTEDSINKGLRGFVTNPSPSGRLEDWMLDAIKWSIEKWKAARCSQ